MTTTKKPYLQVSFENAFAAIEKKVEFQAHWQGDTGYLDGVDLKLGVGERAACQLPAPNSRRMIIVGTQLGNAVVFERFTPDMGQAFVLVSCVPRHLTSLVPSGAMEDHVFTNMFCFDKMNVGTVLRDMTNAVNKAAA